MICSCLDESSNLNDQPSKDNIRILSDVMIFTVARRMEEMSDQLVTSQLIKFA